MNVEVEVTKEQRQTFLVMGVRSLEEGERLALEAASQPRGKLSSQVPRRWARKPELFVTWSTPVLVKDGDVLRDADSSG